MAATKVTGLAAASSVVDALLFAVVDTTNTTMAPTGTDLKATASQVLDYIGSSIGPLNVDAVKIANYSPAVGEFVPVDATSGNITVLLPTGAAIQDSVGVVLVATTGGHTCTVTTQGSDVFLVASGATTTVLSTAGSVKVWIYNGAGIWYPTN